MRSVFAGAFIWTICGSAQTPDVTGHWLGSLKASAVELRLGLHIEKGANGVLSGKLDSIDQGALGIPMSRISLQGSDLTFEVNSASINYSGTLLEDGSEINGMFKQGDGMIPLKFTRVAAMPSSTKPQEPKKPYPYDEIDAAYENTAQKIKLTGTLTVPRQGKPVPAVILITGSGAQDRDESLMGHKPFLVLADYLTRRGIAVLRVDDRGMGGSTGSVITSTTFDFAQDVMAGVVFLKTRREVDATRIGLIGHSEGGIIAPIVASQSKDIAFIVMMAGTGVNGEQLVYEQSAAIMKATGVDEKFIEANHDVQRRMFEVLRTEKDNKAAFEKLKPITGSAEAAKATNPWLRTFLLLDPAEYLRKVKCPVLALNGELDTQVVPRQNLPVIARLLEEAGNRDYTIVKFPKLNHLFQTAKTGAPSEYGKIEETLAPAVLETISTWVLQHTKR